MVNDIFELIIKGLIIRVGMYYLFFLVLVSDRMFMRWLNSK